MCLEISKLNIVLQNSQLDMCKMKEQAKVYDICFWFEIIQFRKKSYQRNSILCNAIPLLKIHKMNCISNANISFCAKEKLNNQSGFESELVVH